MHQASTKSNKDASNGRTTLRKNELLERERPCYLMNMRLDNASEKKLLKKRSDSKDWKLGIKVEFTATGNPFQ
jgi:hypothetical protein